MHVYKLIYSCALFLFGTTIAFAQANSGSTQQLNNVFTLHNGATIILHANTSNAAAYQWYKDGVKIVGAIKKDYKTGISGMYMVRAFNTQGCMSDQSDEVQIIGTVATTKPVIETPLTVTPSTDTLVDLMISLKSSNKKAVTGESFEYELKVNNRSDLTAHQVEVKYQIPSVINLLPIKQSIKGDFEYNPKLNTLIWKIPKLDGKASVNLNVTVKVMHSGIIESTVHVKGREKDPIMANNVATENQQINGLKVPTVFTPNGDGLNDTFMIPGLELYSENEITIINRWGNHLYEKKNYNNEWAGEGLADGTYFYVLKAKNASGVWETYKGYITLLRSRM